MKLEVGMYVRTKYNGIFNIQVLEAIRDIDCDYIEINYIRFPRNEILKASHNIIDLIEVGDYVNGCYVTNRRASVNEHLGGHPKGIGIIKCNAYFNQGNYNDCEFKWIEEKEIKSIVTKEMFANAEYKVETN